MNTSESKKKVIIIGGGLSGLSAGVFGQKNGFLTEIFDNSAVPGGLCQTWKRQGYLIDGCIHWLTGTKSGGSMRQVWDELNAFKDQDVIRDDNGGTFDFNGTRVTMWYDLDKLEKELLEISPEDRKLIHKLIKYIKNIMKIRVPVELPVNLMSLHDLLGVGFNVLPRLSTYVKCTKTQMYDFADKFKSPAIAFALKNMIYGDINIYSMLYAFGTNAYGNGGVLKGGSTVLVDNIVKTYKENRGVIHSLSPVKEIIIKNNKAVGVILQNGEKHFADYVIAAINPVHTMEMLGNKYDIPAYTKRFKNKKYIIPTCLLATLAINKEAKDKLNLSTMEGFNTKEIVIGNTSTDCIKIHDYSYDDVFVKNGKCVCNVLMQQYTTDYDFWNSFKTKDEYNKAKYQIAETIVKQIIDKYPSLEGQIEILDICTPKTFERYTNAYKGAYQSFSFTSKTNMLTHNGKVKGVKNLILASQWTLSPGGLPSGMLTGKYAIQRILKQEHRKYRITKKGPTI